MQIDFSQFALGFRSLSDRPMEIVASDGKKFLSAMLEILLLEGAAREVRETWQSTQLKNLLQHAGARSAFWKSRLSLISADSRQLGRLPALTRRELIQQVEREGSLIRQQDGLRVREHSTSGSSGMPARFFITEANERYNVARYHIEELIHCRIPLNRARFFSDFSSGKPGFEIELKGGSDLQSRGILNSGKAYHIKYGHFDAGGMLLALESLHIAIWSSGPWFMETLLSQRSGSELYRCGLRVWLCLGGAVPPHVRSELAASGIAVSSSYSSEEIGPIGFECQDHPGYYHVTSSNVIVHASKEEIQQDGVSCNRLLVTHLHSYATPLIRYDLGDLGRLLDRCACGFEGQVISHLFGRESGSLLHADGRRTSFNIIGSKIREAGGVVEYRARQVSFTKVAVDVVVEGERHQVSERLRQYLSSVAGHGIHVELRLVDRIDWGPSAKRLGFRCEIA